MGIWVGGVSLGLGTDGRNGGLQRASWSRPVRAPAFSLQPPGCKSVTGGRNETPAVGEIALAVTTSLGG